MKTNKNYIDTHLLNLINDDYKYTDLTVYSEVKSKFIIDINFVLYDNYYKYIKMKMQLFGGKDLENLYKLHSKNINHINNLLNN